MPNNTPNYITLSTDNLDVMHKIYTTVNELDPENYPLLHLSKITMVAWNSPRLVYIYSIRVKMTEENATFLLLRFPKLL